ncbi:hypothetical protein B0T19DRAFT_404262 [Cercophora scortea]|uniref:Uncharacterized protein n=1 Tax=Cercophora scortea TaxID=314031 RepID=A0AAE0M518_9PEZI|nr:hypothetical protein B0T19DRAFT_404262 [Cercophora scortea]
MDTRQITGFWSRLTEGASRARSQSGELYEDPTVTSLYRHIGHPYTPADILIFITAFASTLILLNGFLPARRPLPNLRRLLHVLLRDSRRIGPRFYLKLVSVPLIISLLISIALSVAVLAVVFVVVSVVVSVAVSIIAVMAIIQAHDADWDEPSVALDNETTAR